MDYRERVADLADMQRREIVSGRYFEWLYTRSVG